MAPLRTDQFPSFQSEQHWWNAGYRSVVGVDEVGRGALAGPVVAGACLLASQDRVLQNIQRLGIDDSKRLTPKQRETLVPQIEHFFHCAVGEARVVEITRYGIVEATRKAMRRAIKKLLNQELGIRNYESRKITNNQQQTTNNPYTFLLIDGKFSLPRCPGIPAPYQQPIIRGDQQSITIAAASIIAKVYRDRLMTQLSQQYPQYGWENNKGYGTERHLTAVSCYGVTLLHRLEFLEQKHRSIKS